MNSPSVQFALRIQSHKKTSLISFQMGSNFIWSRNLPVIICVADFDGDKQIYTFSVVCPNTYSSWPKAEQFRNSKSRSFFISYIGCEAYPGQPWRHTTNSCLFHMREYIMKHNAQRHKMKHTKVARNRLVYQGEVHTNLEARSSSSHRLLPGEEHTNPEARSSSSNRFLPGEVHTNFKARVVVFK